MVLDVDTTKGGDASLAALESKHGPLPPTLTARTPSGGRHLYFGGPDVENSVGKLGAGLDIRSHHGYVLAPPSQTVAVSGKQCAGRYEWVNASQPVAGAPEWLIDLAGASKPTRAVAAAGPLLLLRFADAEQLADIRSALDYLTKVPALAGNKTWSDVGLTLLTLGDIGYELWCEFSEKAPGYTPGAPEEWWHGHRNTRRRSDFRSLFLIAKGHGWVNPRSRAAQSAPPAAGTPSAQTQLQPPAAGGASSNVLACADSIEPEAVKWLWKYYLARGKLNLLAGHGSAGKSVVTLLIAATVTTGGKWPDGTQLAEPTNVLIWSSEDDPADTIVPRLIAMGADLGRVFIITGAKNPDGTGKPFDPSSDMPQLRAEIERIGGAGLLILDPIVSAVSRDMHRGNDVRRELQPVVDLAVAHNCAVIGISHFTKGSAKAVPTERVLGSVAFTALARLVLLCAKDETDEMRIFMRSKSNLGPVCDGFMYSIQGVTLRVPLADGSFRVLTDVACGSWGEEVKGSTRELLAMLEPESETQHEGGEFADCKEAMRMVLTGPDGKLLELAKHDVAGKLKEFGYSRKMIDKTRVALHVTYRNSETFPRFTLWRLPTPRMARSVKPAPSIVLGTPHEAASCELPEQEGSSASQAFEGPEHA